ncbi:MAG TPA: hypothetical protein VIL49_01790 [Capillimicrobium sp.]|jgi:hypothetical protein
MKPLSTACAVAVALAAPASALATGSEEREPTGVRVTAKRTAGPYVATVRTCDLRAGGNAEIRVRHRRTGDIVRRVTTDGHPLCRPAPEARTVAPRLLLSRGGALAYTIRRCAPEYEVMPACEAEVLWRWTGRAPRIVSSGSGPLSRFKREGRLWWFDRGGDVSYVELGPSPDRASGPTCDSGRTVARRGKVRVFWRGAAIHACLRPQIGVVTLAPTYSSSTSSAGVGDMAIAGPFVAFAFRGSQYGQAGSELRVVDLRTGRTVKRWSPNGSWAGSTGGGTVEQVRVRSDGAVLWVGGMHIPPCEGPECVRKLLWVWDNDFPTVLDADEGEIADVRLADGNALWTRAGAPRRASLTITCDPYDWRC